MAKEWEVVDYIKEAQGEIWVTLVDIKSKKFKVEKFTKE